MITVSRGRYLSALITVTIYSPPTDMQVEILQVVVHVVSLEDYNVDW